MLVFQIPGESKDAEPSSAFLQFAKSNPILGTKVTRARAVIRFVEIGRRIDSGIYELDRKFNRDTTTVMQFLRYANDVTGKEHRPLADIEGFSGFLFVVGVWMLHIEAFHLPFRREALAFDFAHLAFLAFLGTWELDFLGTWELDFLGIWDLDLGIWDFQCAAYR